jgi:hypothetical protein
MEVNQRNAIALNYELKRQQTTIESQALKIQRLETGIVSLTEQINGLRLMIVSNLGTGPTEV